MSKCLYCDADFVSLTVTQKYCSSLCGTRYRRKHKGENLNPSVTFNCSQCGKTVVTEDSSSDRRSRFCSATCEKKFWRHPHWENPTTKINFHSVEEYASYERRTNA